jgi:cardiolipin synthase
VSQQSASTAVVEPVPDTSRVLTVPNALSVLRLLGVPLFLWLLLGPHADGAAIAVLALSGITDYLDGKIARRFNLVSRLGELLDPAADRLYIASTLAAFLVRDVIPWWLVVVLVGRELVILCTVPVLRRHGLLALPVHFIGKAATFNLLYAFPLLLVGDPHALDVDWVRPIAWGLVGWGTALYVWAGVLYLWQTVLIARGEPGS